MGALVTLLFGATDTIQDQQCSDEAIPRYRQRAAIKAAELSVTDTRGQVKRTSKEWTEYFGFTSRLRGNGDSDLFGDPRVFDTLPITLSHFVSEMDGCSCDGSFEDEIRDADKRKEYVHSNTYLGMKTQD